MTNNNVTMMTDDMDIDFTSFYAPAAEESKNSKFEHKADETRTGQVLDCTNAYHLGTTVFCLIPDKVLTVVNPGHPGAPRLYRKVVWGYDGSVVQADNEKLRVQIQIPRAEDFICALTASQRDIINHLRNQGKIFKDMTSFQNKSQCPEVSNLIRISNPPQIVYSYGKYLKYVSLSKGDEKTPEIGHVRVMKFSKGKVGANDFATILNAQIASKNTAKCHTKWMKDFFNRSVGTHDKAIILKVEQAQGAIKNYMLSVVLDEIAPFEITEEDLQIAENLNTRVYNIENFDDEYYHKLSCAFDKVQGVVDDLSRDKLSVSENASAASAASAAAPNSLQSMDDPVAASCSIDDDDDLFA